MFDLIKLKKLNRCISKLSSGIYPLTGEPFPEDTILNNKHIKACFSDIKLLLEEEIRIIKENDRHFFCMPDDEKDLIEVSSEPIPIGIFTRLINGNRPNNKKRIRPSEITSWLIKEGILAEYSQADGKTFKKTTSKSADFGIIPLPKESPSGRKYDVMMYSKEAQKYIIEHINEIVN